MLLKSTNCPPVSMRVQLRSHTALVTKYFNKKTQDLEKAITETKTSSATKATEMISQQVVNLRQSKQWGSIKVKDLFTI